MGELYEKLIYNKLDEICYNLATYFNYLIIPRQGYYIVGNEDNGTNVKPVIDFSHIIYLLNEIYPCSEFNIKIASNNPLPFKIKETAGRKIAVDVIPAKFRTTINKLIRGYIEGNCFDKIDDDEFRLSLENYKPIKGEDVEINTDVCNKIYNFYSSYKLVLPQDDEGINKLQLRVLKKRTDQNYGFNTDIENTAFQSMIYIITALVDSLGLKTVGINEVTTAMKILIPRDLEDSFVLTPKDDEKIRKLINDAINSKGLTADMISLQLLTNFMQKVNTLVENVYAYSKINPQSANARILNRLLGFSSYV